MHDGQTRAFGDPIGLNRLVGDVYDAALDDTLWAGMSGRIAAAFDATSGVLKLHDPRSGVHLFEMTANLVVADPLREWADHWHDNDLWVERSVSAGLSQVVTSDDLVAPDERSASGFYQEWLPHLGIHHMIGAVFAADGGAVGVLGIHRPRDAAAFDRPERQAAALLLPHLERALRIGRRLTDVAARRDAALASFDTLDTGVIIADARGRIRHVSRIAEAILARCDALALHGGWLRAVSSPVQARLAKALRAAAAVAGGHGFDLPPPMRVERDGRSSITLVVSPLSPRSTHIGWQEPLALILLRDPEHPPLRIDHLRALYAFTPMEAATAAELARGQSLPGIATALGIGIGTVRTHLKQIMLKTGTNRQAQAVALLARSVAVFSSPA